ncbi:MAG: carboxypeptidase-like regulatory domain-containing protein [Gemmataceae bacterium]|nr:carboxypeptidase-like regulatory domain-containing protein [Gemmataceae bacterium]
MRIFSIGWILPLAFAICGFAIFGCAICGCAPKRVESVPVTGAVRLADQPLGQAVILLVSEKDANSARQGTVNSDGGFRIPDVPPGTYKAVLKPLTDLPVEYDNKGRPLPRKKIDFAVPQAYQDAKTTPLTVEVTSPPTPLDLHVGKK